MQVSNNSKLKGGVGEDEDCCSRN